MLDDPRPGSPSTYLVSLIMLVHYLLVGGQSRGAHRLDRIRGSRLWVTNVALFRSPLLGARPRRPGWARFRNPKAWPGLPVPADGEPGVHARWAAKWRPGFLDYAYTAPDLRRPAFSPTDAMPLTQAAKATDGIAGDGGDRDDRGWWWRARVNILG